MSHHHSNNNNNDNGRVRIHSLELLNALTKLNDLLGRTVVERLIDSLKQYYHHHDGVVDATTIIDNSDYYSLNEVQEAFTKMFGSDASQLLLQQLKKRICPHPLIKEA